MHFHGTSSARKDVLDVNRTVTLACQKRLGFVLYHNHFSVFLRQRKGRGIHLSFVTEP